MADWFKLKIPYRTVHLFFPRIIVWILAILAVIMLIQYIVKCKKTGKPFINKERLRFFEKGYNKVMLWGSLILFIAYVFCMEPLGFLLSSIIFVFLFNVLFARSIRKADKSGADQGRKWLTAVGALVIDWKSLMVGAVISLIASTAIWYLFYHVFMITLP